MESASQKFYDRFTIFYPLIDLFMMRQKRRFFSMVNLYPSGRLLEIGVGNGSHLKYYATHNVIGIDTSERMLASARRYETDNIKLLRMNGEALSFCNEAFDYIILSHVIAVVENPDKMLEEVHRVLRPGGKVFILNHFTPDNWLKYIDRSLVKIGRLFHFSSMFRINSLSNIGKFTLLGSFAASSFSYFKILIYEKKNV